MHIFLAVFSKRIILAQNMFTFISIFISFQMPRYLLVVRIRSESAAFPRVSCVWEGSKSTPGLHTN